MLDITNTKNKRWDKAVEGYVIPHKCPCCNKCWFIISGKYTGRCVHGGPYKGYFEMPSYSKR